MYNLIAIALALLAILNQNFSHKIIPQARNYATNETISQEISQNKNAVVMIRGYGFINSNDNNLGNGYVESSQGTGFIVDSNGTIVTNKHVVSNTDMKYWVTTSNGYKYAVDTIDRDPMNDVAVVKIDPSEHPENPLSTIKLGDSDTVIPGQQVVAISDSPGNIEPNLVSGNVTGTGATVIAGDPQDRQRERLTNVIETSLELVPGNSGSPLLDKSGAVVGINTATATGWENISFAVPINAAKEYLNSLD